MSKRSAILVILACLGLALFGCSGSGNSNDGTVTVTGTGS